MSARVQQKTQREQYYEAKQRTNQANMQPTVSSVAEHVECNPHAVHNTSELMQNLVSSLQSPSDAEKQGTRRVLPYLRMNPACNCNRY